MKKILFGLILFILLLTICLIPLSAGPAPIDDPTVIYNTTSYYATQRVADEELWYGIRYINDRGISQTDRQIGGTGEASPQNVNVLEVPIDSIVKVVNWSYSSSNSWKLQTVKNMAYDFEKNNPGWVVLAGINADFFDINGKGALPRQTNGVCVNNGEVVRAVNSGSSVGFTNDGTSNSVIGGKTLTFDSFHTLTIYDETGKVAKEVQIDKFNEEPADNETAIYFSYYYIESEVRKEHVNTVPAENSYIVDAPERGYATSASKIYAKGYITRCNESANLAIGQFALVSKNEAVKNLLDTGVRVRVQQNITGDYADCDNITGAGDTLLDGGEAPANFATDTDYRHPRTIIGKKADGTIVMVTVDGRQESLGMYGVTKQEMSAIMSHYGCVDAYNLDGGGSTTMIIRNAEGDFDIMNSPSDGNERNDANCLLVVVPQMNLKIDIVKDHEASFNYLLPEEGIEFKNLKLTITSDTKTLEKSFDANEFSFDGLDANTDYALVYEYDLTYQGVTVHKTSESMHFSTGKEKPIVKDFTFDEIDDYYYLEFKIEDPENILSMVSLTYDRHAEFIEKSDTSFMVLKSEVNNPEFKIKLVYNHASTPSSTSMQDQYTALSKEEWEKLNPSEVDPTTPVNPDGEKPTGVDNLKVVSIVAVGSVITIGLIVGIVVVVIVLRKKKL